MATIILSLPAGDEQSPSLSGKGEDEGMLSFNMVSHYICFITLSGSVTDTRHVGMTVITVYGSTVRQNKTAS